jgi:DNA-binding CsgD family transcriptional regulator
LKKRIRKINELQNELGKISDCNESSIIKIKNIENQEKILAEKLNNKQTELINFALNIIQKNNFLDELKAKVNELKANTKESLTLTKLNELSIDINSHIALDKNRKTFQLQLEEANQDFYARLSEKFPNLTEKEKRLAAYIRLNFSNKEIASILNITAKSVEINRYRLRKKLNLEQKVNLTDYILTI